MHTAVSDAHRAIIQTVMSDLSADSFVDGELSPYFEIRFGDSMIRMIPPGFFNEADKDVAAKLIRTVCVAYAAESVVLVSEAWASSKGWEGRASEDPNRKEVVVITVETIDGYSATRLDIVRGPDNAVTALKFWDELYGQAPVAGRFSHLLAPLADQNDLAAQEAAKLSLERMFGKLPVAPDSNPYRVALGKVQ